MHAPDCRSSFRVGVYALGVRRPVAYAGRWAPTMRCAITIALSLAVSGCFPASIRALPGSEISVVDAQGSPIENAKLTLATYQDFLRRVVPTAPNSFYSNRKGIIKLPSKRDLVLQVPLPDAYRFYTWEFCISKEGYRATAGGIQAGVRVPQVVLHASDKSSTCHFSAEKRSLEIVDNP